MSDAHSPHPAHPAPHHAAPAAPPALFARPAWLRDAKPFGPYSWQILTGFTLKLLGMGLMVLDHVHEFFLMFGAPEWFTMVGRMVIPIFLFMTAEGFHYTSNRYKYLRRLLVGFWIMSIGSFALNQVWDFEDMALINNIFGTIFLVIFFDWAIDLLKGAVKERNGRGIAGAIGLLVVPFALGAIVITALMNWGVVGRVLYLFIPNILATEGSFWAVAMGVCFYLLRPYGRLVQMIPLVFFSALNLVLRPDDVQWMMIFAIIPIMLYNGKPGRKEKWLFYIFYPVHIWVLFVISALMH